LFCSDKNNLSLEDIEDKGQAADLTLVEAPILGNANVEANFSEEETISAETDVQVCNFEEKGTDSSETDAQVCDFERDETGSSETDDQVCNFDEEIVEFPLYRPCPQQLWIQLRRQIVSKYFFSGALIAALVCIALGQMFSKCNLIFT